MNLEAKCQPCLLKTKRRTDLSSTLNNSHLSIFVGKALEIQDCIVRGHLVGIANDGQAGYEVWKAVSAMKPFVFHVSPDNDSDNQYC